MTDLADLNAQLTTWLLATVANARPHGTTKAVPAVRFAEEQAALKGRGPHRDAPRERGARGPAAEKAHRASASPAKSAVVLRR